MAVAVIRAPDRRDNEYTWVLITGTCTVIFRSLRRECDIGKGLEVDVSLTTGGGA